eukprot:gnl/MRDRNA2_/MRDRNA2_140855_c0_seq1.p1 gnl/MRDRNA2_/MRDRNA2_140855_c0~~gnl/MRDRNA2_/MRDRNA2_140855_c0_seq1.p1  ORF type:complete len:603 (-),score=97.96 gnl/MRDRNA2_/MRDRNA2_140855_c0_seq1:70-1674(-)
MGLETDYPEPQVLYEVLENLFTLVYTVEMVGKLYYERCVYFKDHWNLIDFVLVWMSIVDVWILGIIQLSAGLQKFTALRILRIIRVVRMVRLLHLFRDLWLLVKGMLDSMLTIFWASLLVIMLLYVGGIFCVQTIGKSGLYREEIKEMEAGEEVDYHPDFDSYEFFGTVPRAMFTLFETCLEPLNLRPIIEKQPGLFPFFLIYIFLTTFGVMNVIIGVIVENTMAANKQTENDLDDIDRQEKLQKIEKIRDACFIFDANGDGFITIEELKKGLSEPAIFECLKELEFPIGGDEEELFQLLDNNGTGVVTHDKMMRGLFRSISQNDRMHILEIKASIHRMQRMMHEVTTSNESTSEQLSSVPGTLKDRISRIRSNGTALRRTLRDIAVVGLGGAPVGDSCQGSSVGQKSEKKYLGVWSSRNKDQIVPKINSNSSGRSTPQGLPLTPRRMVDGYAGGGSAQGANTPRDSLTPRTPRRLSRSNSPSGSSTGAPKKDPMRTPPGVGNLLGAADIGASSSTRDPFANLPSKPKKPTEQS